MAIVTHSRSAERGCPGDETSYTSSKEDISRLGWLCSATTAVSDWYRDRTSPTIDHDPRLLDVLLSNRNSWSVTHDLSAAESLRRNLEKDTAVKRLQSRTKSCWTRWLKRGFGWGSKWRRTSWRQGEPSTRNYAESLQLPRQRNSASMNQSGRHGRDETATAEASAYRVW